MGKLRLRELVEHIALVLAPIDAAQQMAAPALKGDAGVVSGGDVVVAQRERTIQQRAELEAAVAVDAGVGRASGAVFGDEEVHHVAREALRFVEHIKIHAEPRGDGARVLRVRGGAAAALRRLAIVELEHRARAVIALPGEQKRGGAGIHAAAHRDHHPFCHVIAFNPDSDS